MELPELRTAEGLGTAGRLRHAAGNVHLHGEDTAGGVDVTNFEKILAETSKLDLAAAFSECYAGQCSQCPALELCRKVEDEDDVGCHDVMLRWLDMEAGE